MARQGLVLTVLGSLALAVPATAHADLVKLTSGAVLHVTGHVVDGDNIVLTLAGGGEVRAPRTIVAAIGPDEVATPLPAAPSPAAETAPSGDALHQLIDRLAAEYGVDPKLAHAVVQVESNYQPDAVSAKGAMGLMQIMPALAKDYSLNDPFDPAGNVAVGLQHLKDLLSRFTPDRALAAYNAGEATVKRYDGVPPYAETRQYVKKVLALWHRQ